MPSACILHGGLGPYPGLVVAWGSRLGGQPAAGRPRLISEILRWSGRIVLAISCGMVAHGSDPDEQKVDQRGGLRPVRRSGSCWGTAAVPRAWLGGLGRGAGRCAGRLRGSWCLAVSRRGEFLRGPELDPAGP